MFVPWGIQLNALGQYWCYIVDSRLAFPGSGANPGTHYIDHVIQYHAGDEIELCGYRWTIVECRLMGRSFDCKQIILNRGVWAGGELQTTQAAPKSKV